MSSVVDSASSCSIPARVYLGAPRSEGYDHSVYDGPDCVDEIPAYGGAETTGRTRQLDYIVASPRVICDVGSDKPLEDFGHATTNDHLPLAVLCQLAPPRNTGAPAQPARSQFPVQCCEAYTGQLSHTLSRRARAPYELSWMTTTPSMRHT